jgi:hypothetical protein
MFASVLTNPGHVRLAEWLLCQILVQIFAFHMHIFGALRLTVFSWVYDR